MGGGQGMDCGDLNKNCPHRLVDLNAWLAESGTMRRCDIVRGDVVLLEEVCH